MSYYYPDTFTPFPMFNVGDAGHEIYGNTDQDPAPAPVAAESTDNWMQYNDGYYYAPVHNVPVGVNELYTQTFGQQPMLATGTETSPEYNVESSSSSFAGTIPAYPHADQAYEGHIVDGVDPFNIQPSSWTGPQCDTASTFEPFSHAAADGYTNWFPSVSYGSDDYNQMESGIIHPSYQDVMMPPSFLSGTCTQAESQVPQSSAFGPLFTQIARTLHVVSPLGMAKAYIARHLLSSSAPGSSTIFIVSILRAWQSSYGSINSSTAESPELTDTDRNHLMFSKLHRPTSTGFNI